jgi:hypothetical protein
MARGPGIDLMKLDFGRKVIGQIFAPDFQTNFHPKTEANSTYNIFNASDATEWSGLQSGRKKYFYFQNALGYSDCCKSRAL